MQTSTNSCRDFSSSSHITLLSSQHSNCWRCRHRLVPMDIKTTHKETLPLKIGRERPQCNPPWLPRRLPSNAGLNTTSNSEYIRNMIESGLSTFRHPKMKTDNKFNASPKECPKLCMASLVLVAVVLTRSLFKNPNKIPFQEYMIKPRTERAPNKASYPTCFVYWYWKHLFLAWVALLQFSASTCLCDHGHHVLSAWSALEHTGDPSKMWVANSDEIPNQACLNNGCVERHAIWMPTRRFCTPISDTSHRGFAAPNAFEYDFDRPIKCLPPELLRPTAPGPKPQKWFSQPQCCIHA